MKALTSNIGIGNRFDLHSNLFRVAGHDHQLREIQELEREDFRKQTGTLDTKIYKIVLHPSLLSCRNQAIWVRRFVYLPLHAPDRTEHICSTPTVGIFSVAYNFGYALPFYRFLLSGHLYTSIQPMVYQGPGPDTDTDHPNWKCGGPETRLRFTNVALAFPSRPASQSDVVKRAWP